MTDFDLFDQLVESFIDLDEEDKKDENVCLHTSFITEKDNDICTECGEIIETSAKGSQRLVSDQNRLQSRRDIEKNIYMDIAGMGFSEKIVSAANDIYSKVTEGSIKRGTSRKAIVFACIFYASKLQGSPYSYDRLVGSFRLKRRICSRGVRFLNLYSPTSIEIKTSCITPLNLISGIMADFGANDEQKQEVIDLYEKIQNRSSKLNRSRPQSVASSLVYYWMTKNKINITLKDFVKRISLSELTINKLTKEIDLVIKGIKE